MPIEIVSSRQDALCYYDNLAFLRRALNERKVVFQGQVNNWNPAITFANTARVYDFTRKAGSRVREDMTTNLSNVLPGLQMDRGKIRAAFDCLFNYFEYKGFLDHVYQQRAESIAMLIFNQAEQYVVHVNFNSTSVRSGLRQFDVHVAMTCQRYTYFPLQATKFDVVLQALQNLHV